MLVRLLIFLIVLYAAWQVGRRILGSLAPHTNLSRTQSGAKVEDMTECPVCGSFVAGTAGRCERPDCPRRG